MLVGSNAKKFDVLFLKKKVSDSSLKNEKNELKEFCPFI